MADNQVREVKLFNFSDLNAKAERLHTWVGARATASILLLISIAVFYLLPGIFSMPPVDRTEVIYAQVARQMIESWNFMEARFGDTVLLDRPFGTLWIHSFFGWLTGSSDQISSYRLASATFTIAGVCAFYFLSRELYGNTAALISALWLAGTPLIVMQAHLALSKPIMMLFVVISQMCLAHIYMRTKFGNEHDFCIKALFWLTQGLAAIIGGFVIAALSLTTVLALSAWHRSIDIFKRLVLHPAALVWLAAMSIWIYRHISYVSQNAPANSETLWSMLAPLLEPQSMHLTAPPGAFILLLVVGVMPMLVMLLPMLHLIRSGVGDRKIIFLLAWILPYILGLELISILQIISDKPPTYMVQSAIPAMALLTGLTITKFDDVRGSLNTGFGKWWLMGFLSMTLLQPFTLIGFAWATGVAPNIMSIVLVFAVSFMFAGAIFALQRHLIYLYTSMACFSGIILYMLLFHFLLPPYKSIWPSWQVKEAITKLGPCAAQPVTFLSYNEPSIMFFLGKETQFLTSPDEAAKVLIEEKRTVVLDSRRSANFQTRLLEAHGEKRDPFACINGVNYARGESVSLEIYVPKTLANVASCPKLQNYICSSQ